MATNLNPFSLENLMNQGYAGQSLQSTSLSPAPSGAQQVGSNLAAFTNQDSDYMENARRRGLEVAATRGGINSSIAAGASQRAALEAAQPLAQQATDIDQRQRQVEQENWLSQQNFNRSLLGQFSTTSFNRSADMLGWLTQASIADPELYSPEIVSGMGNFFQQNMNDVMKRYFGG